MWVGSERSTLCASANEELGTLADNTPLTGLEEVNVPELLQQPEGLTCMLLAIMKETAQTKLQNMRSFRTQNDP